MSHYKPFIIALWVLALLIAGMTLARLPLSAIHDSIAALSATQWTGWITINALIVAVFTRRWQILSSLLGWRIDFFRLLCIRQAGQLVSFITPGPQFGGEPLQIYWLYSQARQPLHKAILTLGLDRFFELWVNFAVLLLGVLYLLVSPVMNIAGWLRVLIILLALLSMLSILGWLVWRQPRWLAMRMERLALYWQRHKLLRQLDAYWRAVGWQAMREDLRNVIRLQRRGLLLAFAVSLFGWLLLISELWLLLTLLDVAVDMPGFILIVVAMRLSMLLPMPGGIGTLEASVLWSFALLQLPASAAMGLIALMRLRDVIMLMGGFVCLRLLHDASTVRAVETADAAD